MDKELPLFSIIIPVKPGGRVKALNALKLIDYPKDRIEVFIAEGCQPSKQRNEAAKQANGDILYFLDDDSCLYSDNLRRLADHFSRSNVAVVGGPSITPDFDSFTQHCFADIFTSPFGGGAVRNRYRKTGIARETTEKELILCNLAIRSDLFKKLGGLNEELYPNEENELMSRIKNEGLSLIHDPDIFVYRSQRKTILAFARQIFSYGRGRMEQTLISPSSFSFLHFVPMFFLLYCISLFIVFGEYYKIPIICYISLTLFFSLKSFFAKVKKQGASFKYLFLLCMLFPMMHLLYGAGMVWGLKRFFGRFKRVKSQVFVKKINCFHK